MAAKTCIQYIIQNTGVHSNTRTFYKMRIAVYIVYTNPFLLGARISNNTCISLGITM